MQAAGLALARLALAVAPHARSVWIACGPGNNGGDGLEAASHLQRWGKRVHCSLAADPGRLPADAATAYQLALQAGVSISDAAPATWDLCLDALLGIGSSRAPEGLLAAWITQMNACAAVLLAVDIPSGLNANTGVAPAVCVRATHTLSLLTLKPGLFTAQGRDHVGQVWFDPLADPAIAHEQPAPSAMLLGPVPWPARPQASHKGSYGDVAIVGGASGMAGAALLAGSGALHGGAGRVFIAAPDGPGLDVDPQQPELMFRPLASLDTTAMTVVFGCGGGSAIAAHLGRILSSSPRLVLDADALNAIAVDSQLQSLLERRGRHKWATVLTPHPLEAARLLGLRTAQVQQDRLAAAQQLAQRFACSVVLKGSGSIVAAHDQTCCINPSGNARLATAGTGDVLAGLTGAALAVGMDAFDAACRSVWRHGHCADQWPEGSTLTAAALARSL